MESAKVYLRLVPAIVAESRPFRRKGFGFAPDPNREGYSSHAYVFYHKIQEFARGVTVSRPELLGMVFAHEIGHLLLGSNSHSPRGIMRSSWSGRQALDEINQGRVYFTPEQAESIRGSLRLRVLSSRARVLEPDVSATHGHGSNR